MLCVLGCLYVRDGSGLLVSWSLCDQGFTLVWHMQDPAGGGPLASLSASYYHTASMGQSHPWNNQADFYIGLLPVVDLGRVHVPCVRPLPLCPTVPDPGATQYSSSLRVR